jgi:hypothetical protein
VRHKDLDRRILGEVEKFARGGPHAPIMAERLRVGRRPGRDVRSRRRVDDSKPALRGTGCHPVLPCPLLVKSIG